MHDFWPEVLGAMHGDRYATWLHWVLVVCVTPLLGEEIPSVGFDNPDDVSCSHRNPGLAISFMPLGALRCVRPRLRGSER